MFSGITVNFMKLGLVATKIVKIFVFYSLFFWIFLFFKTISDSQNFQNFKIENPDEI